MIMVQNQGADDQESKYHGRHVEDTLEKFKVWQRPMDGFNTVR